jgi:hypothetical protein
MKNHRILTIVSFLSSIVFLFLIFPGCSSSGSKSEQEAVEESAAAPPPPVNKLAPGTAKIEAMIVDMNEVEKKYVCKVEVKGVLGYGMSTKPIGQSSILTVSLSKNAEKIVEIVETGSSNQVYIMTIQQQEQMGMSTNDIQWRALQVIKK